MYPTEITNFILLIQFLNLCIKMRADKN